MRVDDFDFELPPDSIALRPVEPRDKARLLEIRPGDAPDLIDHGVGDLVKLLRKDDSPILQH